MSRVFYQLKYGPALHYSSSCSSRCSDRRSHISVQPAPSSISISYSHICTRRESNAHHDLTSESGNHYSLEGSWDTITSRMPNARGRIRTYGLLQERGLNPPPLTRLGYSRSTSNGKGWNRTNVLLFRPALPNLSGSRRFLPLSYFPGTMWAFTPTFPFTGTPSRGVI